MNAIRKIATRIFSATMYVFAELYDTLCLDVVFDVVRFTYRYSRSAVLFVVRLVSRSKPVPPTRRPLHTSRMLTRR